MSVTRHEIISLYNKIRNAKETGIALGVSIDVVRKVLASEGIYTSEHTRIINELYNKGESPEEIAKKLDTSVKAVFRHLPYRKCSYTCDPQTENALRVQKSKKKKREKQQNNA